MIEALEALFAEDAALVPLDDAARQGLLQAGEDIKAGRVTPADKATRKRAGQYRNLIFAELTADHPLRRTLPG